MDFKDSQLWKTVEQLIRIGMYVFGSMLMGSSYVESDVYQALIGFVITAASLGWWMFFEKDRITTIKTLEAPKE